MEKPKLIPADYLRDNPFAERHMYKIYHDGDHPVATRIVRSKGKRPPKKPAQTAFDIAFDGLYFQAKRKGLSGDEMADYIQAGLTKLYPASSTLRKYILEKIDKKQRNLWKRIKRFKRKVNMNRWNYSVTFTCDPKKHTEESFRKKLRKCLSNLHTRRGWKYMGVFEYGELNGSIHFHALIYIPEGEMIGELVKKREYSTKRGERRTRYILNDKKEKMFFNELIRLAHLMLEWLCYYPIHSEGESLKNFREIYNLRCATSSIFTQSIVRGKKIERNFKFQVINLVVFQQYQSEGVEKCENSER